MLTSKGLRALTGTNSGQQEPDKNYGDACLLRGNSKGEGNFFVSPDFKV